MDKKNEVLVGLECVSSAIKMLNGKASAQSHTWTLTPHSLLDTTLIISLGHPVLKYTRDACLLK